MKIQKSFKNLKSENITKLICVLGFVLLLLGTIKRLVTFGFNFTSWDIETRYTLPMNGLSMTLFVIAYFSPRRVEVLAFISFMYTVTCVLEKDAMNVMGLFMYFLTISVFIYRGFYLTKKPLKITLTVLLIFGLYATKLRFGLDNFINAMFQFAGYSLVYACSLIFLANYQKKKYSQYFQSRILDLSDYDENQLSSMDKEWLELALTNEKYDSIARKYGYSEGHVKNRMRYIFATLDVIDRIDLFSKYAGCKVIKNKEELQNWKQELLES